MKSKTTNAQIKRMHAKVMANPGPIAEFIGDLWPFVRAGLSFAKRFTNAATDVLIDEIIFILDAAIAELNK